MSSIKLVENDTTRLDDKEHDSGRCDPGSLLLTGCQNTSGDHPAGRTRSQRLPASSEQLSPERAPKYLPVFNNEHAKGVKACV